MSGSKRNSSKKASGVNENTKPIKDRKFSYAAMRRAAEVGAVHGYYMAYTKHGLKAGEAIDVAALTDWALKQVRDNIKKIEGIGFIEYPDQTERIDVLKEVVEIAASGGYKLSQSMASPLRRGKKKKQARRLAVEGLLEQKPLITFDEIVRQTKHTQPKRERKNAVKHQKAIYDILREIAPNKLKTKE